MPIDVRRLCRRLLAVIVPVIAAVVLVPGPARACEMAHTWAERTLCQYEDLGRIDRSVQARFGDVAKGLPTAERERLRGEQRAWLARREDCRTAAQPMGCLAASYRKRLAELDRREARADLLLRPPAATDTEPFEAEARRIARLTIGLRKRTAEDAAGTAFLWSDGSQPVMLVEPATDRGAPAGGTRYYFRKGALFYVEGNADRAGFEDGEMLFWLNAAGKPASTTAAAWPVRQQQLLARAAALLALFGER